MQFHLALLHPMQIYYTLYIKYITNKNLSFFKI